MPEESKSIDGCCRRGADLNAAGLSQIGHRPNPVDLDIMLAANGLNWLGDGGIRVLRQEHQRCSAGVQGFAQLFATDDDPSVRKL